MFGGPHATTRDLAGERLVWVNLLKRPPTLIGLNAARGLSVSVC